MRLIRIYIGYQLSNAIYNFKNKHDPEFKNFLTERNRLCKDKSLLCQIIENNTNKYEIINDNTCKTWEEFFKK